jgi:hypothetical protein
MLMAETRLLMLGEFFLRRKRKGPESIRAFPMRDGELHFD